MSAMRSGVRLVAATTKVRSLLGGIRLFDHAASPEGANRLARFFSKLLSEAQHLGIESLSIVASGESCDITAWKGQGKLAVRRLKREWFLPICRWLMCRDVPALGSSRRSWASLNPETDTSKLTCAARAGGYISCFNLAVKHNADGVSSCVLSAFRHHSPGGLLSEAGLSEDHKALLESALAEDSGILLVGGPNMQDLADSLATLLAISNLPYAGDLADLQPEQLYACSTERGALVTFEGMDCIRAVSSFKSRGLDPKKLRISGAICQMLAERVCPYCTGDLPTPPELPAWLASGSALSSRRGKGCPSCNQTGSRGYVGVQSVMYADNEIKGLLLEGADEQSLADLATGRGTRPLADDVARKIRDGAISIASAMKLELASPGYKVRSAGRRTMFASYLGTESPGVSSGEMQPVRAEGPAPQEEPKRGDKARPLLMVVEDDHDQRSILEMVLRSAHYDVILASNGLEALKLLQTSIPDLIISDLMMADMDGSELVKALKAHGRYNTIPVLVLTVVADPEREFQLLDLGADDYCEKTIQRKIFLKRIENLLKRAHAGEQHV